jgi:DNA-binding SARP family transcriptional activator
VVVFSPFGDGLLGREGDPRPLTRLRGEKARELLAFALWKARPITRDEIVDAVWDGDSTSQSLGAIRTAAYQIRRYLGARAWARVQGGYALAAPVDDDFRTLLALAVSVADPAAPPAEVAAMATRGAQLYRGAYLPWCYSAWTDQPRALAQRATLTIVSALVGARRALGQPLAALEASELGLAIDPQHEGLRQAHMELLVELGRPAEALDSYRRFRAILHEEGLAQPPLAMRALASSLRQR